MSKVLAMGTNTDGQVSVLSKAKKDNVGKSKSKPAKAKTRSGPEGTIDAKDLVASDSDDDSEVDAAVAEPHVPVSVLRAKKREIDAVCRVKPDITKRATERTLAKIATRGVVQLFNAVREQQKSVKVRLKEAGSSRNREKVLKSINKDGFLAVLEGKRPSTLASPAESVQKKAKVELKEEEEEDEDTATWSALRQDFMLGAKLKDWDKESDNEH